MQGLTGTLFLLRSRSVVDSRAIHRAGHAIARAQTPVRRLLRGTLTPVAAPAESASRRESACFLVGTHDLVEVPALVLLDQLGVLGEERVDVRQQVQAVHLQALVLNDLPDLLDGLLQLSLVPP